MSRITRGVLLLNATVVVVWLMLRAVWFDGSIGCDESMPPQPEGCDTKGDAPAYLAWAGAALFILTLGWLVLLAATSRRRAPRD
jgi:hypothetical protein